MDHEQRNLAAALKEALAKERVNRFNQQNNSQLVGSMKAGRDIKVEQIINNSPELRDWDSSFVKSPIGQIIVAAVGGFLSFLLGKLFGG